VLRRSHAPNTITKSSKHCIAATVTSAKMPLTKLIADVDALALRAAAFAILLPVGPDFFLAIARPSCPKARG